MFAPMTMIAHDIIIKIDRDIIYPRLNTGRLVKNPAGPKAFETW
jgi:hypothetical protein